MEKLFEYLNTHGFWFSCSDEQDKIAQEACKQNIIKPIESIGVGYKSGEKSFFYIRFQLQSKEELPISMWRHFVEGIGC